MVQESEACPHHWSINNEIPPVGVCLKCDEVREFPSTDVDRKYGQMPWVSEKDDMTDILSRAMEQAYGMRR